MDIEAGKFTHNKKVHHTHEGSIGNLCNDRIENLMQQVVDGFNFSVMEQAEQSLWVDRNNYKSHDHEISTFSRAL